MFYADTCKALRRAADRGDVTLQALARDNYPGTPLPDDALSGLRTVGFWDARTEQTWGLDWHRNEGIELTYVAQGKLAFSIEDEDHTLRPGDLTITRPWQRHRVGRPFVGASRLHWLILDVGVRRPNEEWTWPSWCILSTELQNELAKLLLYNEQPVWRADPSIIASFDKLAQAVAGEDIATRATKIAIAVNELLLSVVEMLQLQRIPLDSSLASSRRSVEMFLDSLHEHVGARWTLEMMAEACGLGRSQFSQYCRELTNSSPIEFLNRCRIASAMELLREPRRSITTVAFECGFESSQYFATVFRRYVGCSPREFQHVHLEREAAA